MESIYFVCTDCKKPFINVNHLERKNGFNLDKHSHLYWQAILVTEGALTVCTDDTKATIGAGTLHILPPGYSHALSSDGYRQIGIDFTDDAAGLSHVYSLFSTPSNITSRELGEYARHLATLDRSTPPAHDIIHTLCTLILQTAAAAAYNTSEAPLKAQILKYIDAHPSCCYTLDDIAESLFISVSHLERMSHSLFGMGIIALRNRRRHENACTMLIGTDLSVGSIGESLGFTEPSNFSAFFKRYAGISPAEYRRRFTQ